MRRYKTAFCLLALSLLLASAPATAEESLPKRRLVDLRLAVSAVSLTAPPQRETGSNAGISVSPIELGLGVHLADNFSVALLGRAGFLQAGGGVEVVALGPGSDWWHSGLAVRLAGVVMVTSHSPFGYDTPAISDNFPGYQPNNAFPIYVLAELGLQYRWVGPRLSLGLHVTAGSERIHGLSSPAGQFVVGFLGPRLQVEL